MAFNPAQQLVVIAIIAILIGLLLVDAFGCFEIGDRVTAPGQGFEMRQGVGFLVVVFPEFLRLVGQVARKAGDGFDMNGDLRAEFRPTRR